MAKTSGKKTPKSPAKASPLASPVATRSYRVAVIPGDGIGPEVTAEALKVLDAVSRREGFRLDLVHYDLGGERYLRTGEIVPDSVLTELKGFKSIYLGAIGHPDVKQGVLEKGILLKLRFHFDQYVNLRPIRLYPGVDCPLKDKKPADIDFHVVRENTEDAYAGIGGNLKINTPDEVAIQEMIYTRKGTERIIRYAFELCRRLGRKKKLTLCYKANVLTYGHDLWDRVFAEVGSEYPDIAQDRAYVDATCMWMVKNPEWFDVIVTTNMFGDIITDLGAMIQGGMGLAASGNINPAGLSMFEPIHGSAPKYKGKNVICPLAAIGAAQMMLEHLGEKKAADHIEKAFVKALGEGRIKGLSTKSGQSTTQMGDIMASLAATL
jgi:3-isopropylmalate dehydrogenase